MTEAERIKQEGWLPENFFEAETRCDYYISAEMKKVWAILLDLYKELARVCEKNNLQYFAAAGTLLGAVRHKGMIPWDDDMDIAIPRESYERLKGLASEFKEPYFLQSSDTDPEYGFSYMRLCNSNTTVVTKPLQYAEYNHGIYIDIFPQDRASDNDIEARRDKIFELIMKNTANMRLKNPHKSQADIDRINKYYDPKMKPADIFHEIEKIASEKEADDSAPYLTTLVFTEHNLEKYKRPKRVFDNFVEVLFEDAIPMRLPVGYEEYLTLSFGDYMELPPVENRGNWHIAEYYPDIPYKEYYKKHFNISY